jgi:predicted DNA binding CopG/RHH family protein
MKKNKDEILEYDTHDTSAFIDTNKPKSLKDLGLKLPKEAPTTVVSIRLPNRMLNAIRAFASENDLPYQSVIKMFLQQEIKKRHLE